jgi:signal transduction histidine kinase
MTSIRWRLLTLCITLVTVPTLIVGTLAYTTLSQETMKTLDEKLAQTATNWRITAYSYINQEDRILRREESLTKQRLAAISLDTVKFLEIASYGNGSIRGQGTFNISLQAISDIRVGRSGYVFILDANGTYLLSRGRLDDGGNIFQDGGEGASDFAHEMINAAGRLDPGQTYEISTVWAESRDAPARRYLASVASYKPLGLAVVTVSPYTDFKSYDLGGILQKELKDIIAEQRIGETGNIWVVDGKGDLLVSKDRLRDGENIMDEKDLRGAYYVRALIDCAQYAQENETCHTDHPWKDVEDTSPTLTHSSAAYVPGWDWAIVASIKDVEYTETQRRVAALIIIISAISIIAGSAAAYWLTLEITNPIKRLEEKSLRAAGGDLDISAQDIASLGGEIGNLAASFDTMVANLRKKILEAESSKAALTSSNMEIEEAKGDLEAKLDELGTARTALLNMMEDLTEAKAGLETKVEERTKDLMKALEEVKASDQMKDNFLAITSHELKTPLTPIILYTELLQETLKDLDPANRQFLDTVHSEALLLRDLILDILELAKIDARQRMYNIVPANMRDVLAEAVAEVEPIADARKIMITNEADSSLPMVPLDKSAIKRVLTNLLTNALKFSPNGSKITMNAALEGDMMLVSVKDEGIGIDKVYHQRIFDRFFQVEKAQSRAHGGTGLGLAICKGNVEAHGGRIWLESEPGKGSTFKFTLPLTQKGGN